MNEAETRAELIDPKLQQDGWITADNIRVHREHPITDGEIKTTGIRTGKLKADYVLSYKNRKLAVIEAKSDEVEVGEGVAQAKLYSQKLGLETCYSTNGRQIYQICLKTGKEEFVSNYLSPEDLYKKTFETPNNWQEKFNSIPFNDLSGQREPRYFSERAVNNALDAIAKGKQRILLTLATGTGKTFIAFQIAWKLFNARWTIQKDEKRRPRVLFLADRNILADQAYNEFEGFTEDARIRINPDLITNAGQVPRNANIFFTIFQTFMSGRDDNLYFREYEKDFFDLVIIDECHRGGANDESSWREILNHFSEAVHIGLTATPKRDDNVDTYEYFGEPVFVYSLKEGIQDGYLTPFKIKRITTSIDEYQYEDDDEVLQGEPDEQKIYKESDFNQKIFIEERERVRVKATLTSIIKNEKTLVFCANQSHAALIRDMINQELQNTPTDYCVRVTANDGVMGDNYLRRFQDNSTEIPTILTTSQKLTTGVDARNVRNIVLLRPIKSMIQFKQIIGRGTRLYDGKYFFTIIDFVGASELFNDSEWDGDPIDPVIDPEDNPDPIDKPITRPVELKIKIKLADGKERSIVTTKYSQYFIDGKIVTAEEYINIMFEKTISSNLLKNEDHLRNIWANPKTRSELLVKLEQSGCGKNELIILREIFDATESDFFDVLQYLSYANPKLTRSKRVELSQERIYQALDGDQKDFIQFVLNNYIKDSDEEISLNNLSKIIKTKYGSINEAQSILGNIDTIQKIFCDFQQELYSKKIA